MSKPQQNGVQLISKIRRLPTKGHFLYKVGDRVNYDTIIGEVDYIPGQLIRLDIANQLGIPPEILGEVLTKAIDTKIEIDEIIAATDHFFSYRSFRSHTDGYLALWSHFLGYAYIRKTLPTGPAEPITFLAEDLGLSRTQFIDRLTVEQDDIVAPGQLLLEDVSKAFAPALSRVSYISKRDGIIIVTPLFQSTKLPALIDGILAEIIDEDSCQIKSVGMRFLGAVGYGTEGSGFIKALNPQERDLELSDLTEELEGSILISRGGITLDALHRLTEMQISGLVLGCIDIETLHIFSGSNPLKNLGALMDIPFPLIIMQGFGAAMIQTTYNALADLQGRRAFIDSHTQLRAGVVRPEILVPLIDIVDLTDAREEALTEVSLSIGEQVILTREPHFGAIATIIDIDAHMQNTPAGTRAILVTICLDDGQVLQVPRNNCRIAYGVERSKS